MASWNDCHTCYGSGITECESCFGTGSALWDEDDLHEGIDSREFCEDCLGEGELECDECVGEGGAWCE